MPRTDVPIPHTLEHVSVLAPDGTLDRDLAPDLPPEELRRMHATMRLSRRLDERLLAMQRQGRIGTFAPATGQEAAQVGAASALRPTDWVVPSYREAAVFLWRGIPMTRLLLFHGGWTEGAAVPDGSRDLPPAIPVASQLPHACGIAFAIRHRGGDEVAMTLFGDGATSEGDFHEAMNMAGVMGLPVVFVCQNNGWAISVPRERQTASATLAQKAVAYGFPGVQCDGNDPLAVRLVCDEAVARARAGAGPTLVECLTYRLGLHTTADDPTKYRDEAEVQAWRRRDPLPRFERFLAEEGVLAEGDLEILDERLEAEVATAVADYEREAAGLPGPSGMFAHLYAQEPEGLTAQREAAEADLASRDGDVG